MQSNRTSILPVVSPEADTSRTYEVLRLLYPASRATTDYSGSRVTTDGEGVGCCSRLWNRIVELGVAHPVLCGAFTFIPAPILLAMGIIYAVRDPHKPLDYALSFTASALWTAGSCIHLREDLREAIRRR